MAIIPSTTWPTNELGELVIEAGVGSETVVGDLPEGWIPTNPATRKPVFRLPSQFLPMVKDAQGNAVGLQSPGGPMISIGGIQAPLPSGDLSGVTDRVAINAMFLAASNGYGRAFIRKGSIPYIVDQALTAVSGVHTEMEPGTVIKVRDSVTVDVSCQASSAIVTLPYATTIVAGMAVSDPAANLQANDPFGAVPYNTKVLSVNATGTVITLDKPISSTGTKPLTFHPRTNAINIIDVDNASFTCNGGWAEFNGNWRHSYPYGTTIAGAGSDDAVNNAIRVVNPSNLQIDGIIGAEGFYHGLIGVGRSNNVRVVRYRGRNNGYRAIHFHGEAANGELYPDNKEFTFGRVESHGNGHRAFAFQNQGEFQSGIYVVFENSRNVQMESVYSRDDYGFGLHMSGGVESFLAAAKGSKFIQVGRYISENAAVALRLDSGIESVSFGDVTATGKKQTVPSCVFLAAAAIPVYYVKNDGSVGTFQGKYVDLPSATINGVVTGAIAAYGLRPGIRMYAGAGASGMIKLGAVVYATSYGTGAGGVDQVLLMNYESPSSAPYTASGTGDGYFRFARDALLDMQTDVSRPIRGITFGTIKGENMGNYGLKSSSANTAPRFFDIHFGAVSLTGAAFRNLEIGNLNMFDFTSLHVRNAGTGREVGSVNGGFDAALYNCNNGQIKNITGIQDAVFVSNNERMRLDVNCRNVKLEFNGMPRPIGAPVVNVQTATGAPANLGGVTGPVILENPTASDGAPLTVAGGHVARVDATACIVTRPVDAA